jgi:hypothetical protein
VFQKWRLLEGVEMAGGLGFEENHQVMGDDGVP